MNVSEASRWIGRRFNFRLECLLDPITLVLSYQNTCVSCFPCDFITFYHLIYCSARVTDGKFLVVGFYISG